VSKEEEEGSFRRREICSKLLLNSRRRFIQSKCSEREDTRSLSMVSPQLADQIREKVNPEKIISLDDDSCSFIDASLTSVQNTLVLPPFTSFSPPISSYLYWRLLDV
jgi:hypothetical protein